MNEYTRYHLSSLLQCWSFSTTAPTTRIASKPAKRHRQKKTESNHVKPGKSGKMKMMKVRKGDFSLKLFSSQSIESLRSFISDALIGKSSNMFFHVFFQLNFHHNIFDLMSFLRRKLMISTGRAWVSVVLGGTKSTPRGNQKFPNLLGRL